MLDFIFAAIPWVIFSITIALVLTNNKTKKKRALTKNQDNLEATITDEKENLK